MRDISKMTQNQKLTTLRNRDQDISDNNLREFAKDRDEDIRCAVTDHPNTPADLLGEMAKDKSELVRRYVAYNSKTPVDALRDIAKSSNWFSRCNVARNPSTPQDVLKYLATDKDSTVRATVAVNRKSSREILVILFEYEKGLDIISDTILKNLYKNPNFPVFAKRVMETLFGDMLYWI